MTKISCTSLSKLKVEALNTLELKLSRADRIRKVASNLPILAQEQNIFSTFTRHIPHSLQFALVKIVQADDNFDDIRRNPQQLKIALGTALLEVLNVFNENVNENKVDIVKLKYIAESSMFNSIDKDEPGFENFNEALKAVKLKEFSNSLFTNYQAVSCLSDLEIIVYQILEISKDDLNEKFKSSNDFNILRYILIRRPEDISEVNINEKFRLSDNYYLLKLIIEKRPEHISEANLNEKFKSFINTYLPMLILEKCPKHISKANLIESFKFSNDDDLLQTILEKRSETISVDILNEKIKLLNNNYLLSLTLEKSPNAISDANLNEKFKSSNDIWLLKSILQKRPDAISNDNLNEKFTSSNKFDLLKLILEKRAEAITDEYLIDKFQWDIDYNLLKLIFEIRPDAIKNNYLYTRFRDTWETSLIKVIVEQRPEAIDINHLNQKFEMLDDHSTIMTILGSSLANNITSENIAAKYRDTGSIHIITAIRNYVTGAGASRRINLPLRNDFIVNGRPLAGIAFEVHNYTDGIETFALAMISKYLSAFKEPVPSFTIEDLRAKFTSVLGLDHRDKAISALDNILSSDDYKIKLLEALPKIAALLNSEVLWQEGYDVADNRWELWLNQSFVEAGNAYTGNNDTVSCVKGIYERLFTGFRTMHPMLDVLYTAQNVATGFDLRIISVLDDEKDNILEKLKDQRITGTEANFTSELIQASREVMYEALHSRISEQLGIHLSKLNNNLLDELVKDLTSRVTITTSQVLERTMDSDKLKVTIKTAMGATLKSNGQSLIQYVQINLQTSEDVDTTSIGKMRRILPEMLSKYEVLDENFLDSLNSILYKSDIKSTMSDLKYIESELTDRNKDLLAIAEIATYITENKKLIQDRELIKKLRDKSSSFGNGEKIQFNFYNSNNTINPRSLHSQKTISEVDESSDDESTKLREIEKLKTKLKKVREIEVALAEKSAELKLIYETNRSDIEEFHLNNDKLNLVSELLQCIGNIE